MARTEYIKMTPCLALWEIIDGFSVKGYVQTAGYVVLVPRSEYERVVHSASDKPRLLDRIKSLTKKEQ